MTKEDLRLVVDELASRIRTRVSTHVEFGSTVHVTFDVSIADPETGEERRISTSSSSFRLQKG